jgi:hypothetical protein
VNVTAAANIAGATLDDMDTMVITGDTDVTMTKTQYAVFDGAMTATGDNQITISDNSATLTGITSIQKYVLGNGTNSFTAAANVTNITGGSAGDTFVMAAGMVAGVTIIGGAGDDTITLTNDTAVTDLDNISTVENIDITATGASVYTLSASKALIAAGATLDVDNLSTNNMTLNIANNAGNGILDYTGNNGVDIITGSGGADVLKGGAGADQLNGGAGADTITGGAAADTIHFGDGDGAIDTYIMSSGMGSVSIIDDFEVGSGNDKFHLDLSEMNAILDALTSGSTLRQLSNTDGEDASTATSLIVASAGELTTSGIEADIIQITGDRADAAAAGALLETGGANTITFTRAMTANDAFLMLWHDANHSYLSYVKTGVIDAGDAAGNNTFTEVNLLKFEGIAADQAFHTDNFTII